MRFAGRRLPAAIVLAALCALAPLSPGVSMAAAASSSDIPGIPMSASVASGSLGGPVYDVVYRLTVQPGSVIVASLRGSAGTDFDLYLFGSTATTVISNAGLLTDSTGPTSTEAISWATRDGGTFYLDLNGASNVEGTYTLAVALVPDSVAPSVSMLLASGRPTNRAAVQVALTVSDPLAAPAEMAFSQDGVTYGAWEPFAANSTWVVPAGDGTHDLWVKVSNSAGLESAPAHATVIIDTAAPTSVNVVPPPGASVVGLRPQFAVTFSEPMDPATWTQLGLVVQDASGSLVAGVFAYDGATSTGTFVPSADLVPGAVYIVTIGNVTDLAGNRVASRGSWTVAPLVPTSVTASASPVVLGVGGRSTISVALAGPPEIPALDILARAAGDAGFVAAGSLPLVGSAGQMNVHPFANTTYRFSYAGSATAAPAVADVRLVVRRSVVLDGPGVSVVRAARVGRSMVLVAAINPRSAGVTVTFTLSRWDTARRAWVVVSRRSGNSNGDGRVSTTWKPASPGSWSVRIAALPTPDYANNVSGIYRFAVTP